MVAGGRSLRRRPGWLKYLRRVADLSEMPICGKCRRSHASSAAVRACYFGSKEQPKFRADEEHGRRVLRGDGANEITARFLRASPTPSEEALWRWLRGGFRGYRFDQQVPLFGYVVDFYCPSLSLAVEVDGSSHRWRAELDNRRDDWIKANHVAVVRLSATLVLQDIQAALRAIAAAMRQRAVIRPQSRRPTEPVVRIACRHGRDSLLCERCKRVEQYQIERQQVPVVVEKRWERRPSSGRSRSGSGMVNRPPAAPGTISRQNY